MYSLAVVKMVMRIISLWLLGSIVAAERPSLLKKQAESDDIALDRPASFDTSLEASPFEVTPFDVSELLKEVERALGSVYRQDVQNTVDEIETDVRPIFDAMQKNEYGNLGEAGVRYTLHRYFVNRYAWRVRGLDTRGAAYNTSSPADLFRGHAPVSMIEAFKKRLIGRGFSLRDTATLAATFESIVHNELLGTLEAAYHVRGWKPEQNLSTADGDLILDTYMEAHLLELNMSKSSLQSEEARSAILSKMEHKIGKFYPNWPATQTYVRDVKTKHWPSQENIHFGMMLKIVHDIVDHWGTRISAECIDLKHKLVAVEDTNSGCVRAADFYRNWLDRGMWQFRESPAYLREEGIWEESNPANPHVLIANYVNSAGNCLASSQYYSVCCQDECEGLTEQLESKFGADATIAQVAETVAAMSSATMPANRALPQALLDHLYEVAKAHDDRVVFHGRLFMQWMHEAFPRECAYPHMSGTTQQRTPLEKGKKSIVNRRHAQELIDSWPQQKEPVGNGGAEATCVPWVNAEELVHPEAALSSSAAFWQHMTDNFMLSVSHVGALAAFAILFALAVRSLCCNRKKTDCVVTKEKTQLASPSRPKPTGAWTAFSTKANAQLGSSMDL